MFRSNFIFIAMFVGISVSTPTFAADDKAIRNPRDIVKQCTPENKSSPYVIDLGDYRGVFAFFEKQNFACPQVKPCTCELQLPAPEGDWKLVFSGDSATVPVSVHSGKLEVGKSSFLGNRITARDNRIVLSPSALRTVRFVPDDTTVTLGIELWDDVNRALKKHWREGKDYLVKMILGVDNKIIVEGLQQKKPNCIALTVSNSPLGFSKIPSFMKHDFRHRRALKMRKNDSSDCPV